MTDTLSEKLTQLRKAMKEDDAERAKDKAMLKSALDRLDRLEAHLNLNLSEE